MPNTMVLRGMARHSETNGGIEGRNRTAEERLGALMSQFNSTRWAILCKLVQWIMNTSKHTAMKKVPYHALTGQNPQSGLFCFPMAPALLNALHSEAELLIALGIDGETSLENAVLPELPNETALATEPRSCRNEYRSASSRISDLESENQTLKNKLAAAELALSLHGIEYPFQPPSPEQDRAVRHGSNFDSRELRNVSLCSFENTEGVADAGTAVKRTTQAAQNIPAQVEGVQKQTEGVSAASTAVQPTSVDDEDKSVMDWDTGKFHHHL